VLVDDGLTVVESSIIIEHLDQHHPGPVRFIPNDPEAALEVRLMDRFFDNYSMSAMQKPVFEALSRRGARKEDAMSEARVALDTAYAWLERRLAGRAWAAGDDFTMADCAAAPSLFYADWVHQIAPTFPRLREYRAQLLSRPSFARALEEGRPYRGYFPLGAQIGTRQTNELSTSANQIRTYLQSGERIAFRASSAQHRALPIPKVRV
jgi:glutathione S-transferase